MKQIKTIAIALLVVFSTAVNAQTKKVDTSKSTITWVGKKVTGKHDGTVNLTEGSLTFKNKSLVDGTFTVNMNSIAVTDLKSGEGKEKLEGHLKSNDFFGTDKYPTSKLVFKTVMVNGGNKYTVAADLTIKDKTNPITFDIFVNGNSATAKLVIDRSKYDVKYNSTSFFESLGDKAIYDDFELDVTLKF